MKRLVMAVSALMLGVTMVGCGKSDRDRFLEAMNQVLTDKEEITRETKHFDESSAEDQCKQADYAEYFALLKKTSGGVMSMRDIKKTVSKTFEGMSAEQRKDYLKKCQEEMKRGGR